jgi:hypothetical protein
LTILLNTISKTYPQLFFKPLFSLAASSKEINAANHLWALSMISRYVPDLWTRDSEMMSVALVGAVSRGRGKEDEEKEDVQKEKGVAKLGQGVLLMELISKAREVRKVAEAGTEKPPTETMAFFAQLELRLGMLLETKEQTVLVPCSLRILFCTFLYEARLVTRSMRQSALVAKALEWLLESPLNLETGDERDEEEAKNFAAQLSSLYDLAKQGSKAAAQVGYPTVSEDIQLLMEAAHSEELRRSLQVLAVSWNLKFTSTRRTRLTSSRTAQRRFGKRHKRHSNRSSTIWCCSAGW